MASPAVDVPENIDWPHGPASQRCVKVALPAVAPLSKSNCPAANAIEDVATKFCAACELFITPLPAKLKKPSGQLNVNALEFALKTILSTWMLPDKDILVVLETPKVAMSAGPLGTVAGVQFAEVFQSTESGVVFQVALPARADCMLANKKSAGIHVTRRKVCSIRNPTMITDWFFICNSFTAGLSCEGKLFEGVKKSKANFRRLERWRDWPTCHQLSRQILAEKGTKKVSSRYRQPDTLLAMVEQVHDMGRRAHVQ